MRWSSELTEVDALSSIRIPSSLDLQGVDQAQRAVIWKQTAHEFFPGLSVRELDANPGAGWMQGRPFGAGHLWAILSPPLQVSYSPGDGSAESVPRFSVMLQLQGSTVVRQSRRTCQLRPREICVVDEVAPFELEVAEGASSQFMFLQIPRYMVLGRCPYLERCTAAVFDSEEPGAILLSNVLHNLLESASLLEDDQCAAALSGVIQLLGVPKPPQLPCMEEVSWRVRAALSLIDAELGDPNLSATTIARAQGISRRRLDEVLLKAVGTSVTAQIWMRRLTRAASDLRDPRHASKTITQIAFGVGFEDTAHFARAFKRRYHCTPREWRNGLAEAAPFTPRAVQKNN